MTALLARPCPKCQVVDRNKHGRCKPCTNLSNAGWRARNPEKHKAASNAWRIANPEKSKICDAAWAKENPEKRKAYIAAWFRENPEARRIYKQNHKARKAASGGALSKDLSVKLFALQKGKCACCKQPLGDNYHLDHIMPLALGGANTDDNIQLLRPRCNMQKHAKHPADFMRSRGFLL